MEMKRAIGKRRKAATFIIRELQDETQRLSLLGSDALGVFLWTTGGEYNLHFQAQRFAVVNLLDDSR